MIEPFLEDLETRLQPEIEQTLLEDWRKFTAGEFSGDFFSPLRSHPSPPAITWPKIPINDTLDNFEKMFLSQLGLCSQALAEGSGRLLTIRANYGTSILASLFGPELFIMDRELDTLPTSRPLAGGKTAIRRLLEAGVPPIEQAYAGMALKTSQRYRDILQPYPKLAQYVFIYHPDTQGPMDLCELLWGSRLFIDIIDEPELVLAFLDLLSETYIRYMHTWQTIIPQKEPFAAHWSMLHPGRIMLRDDSAMNFSPRMFNRFIKPFDQRLLQEFGGGAVHFCGKGDHYIHSLSQVDGLKAVQMGQPELNDMEVIYRNTIDNGIPLLDLPYSAVIAAQKKHRDLHGLVHSWLPIP